MPINRYVKEVKKNFVSPVNFGAINIPSIRDTVIMKDSTLNNQYYLYEKSSTDSPSLQNNEITITKPTGENTVVATGLDQSATVSLDNVGIYTIRYRCVVALYSSVTIQSYPENFTFSFPIAVVSNVDPKPLWNIKTVVERLLRVNELRTLNDTKGMYHLNAEQAEEFAKIPAPEFAITNKTLKEALDIVGSYIHGVPRIRDDRPELNEFVFDMLGGTEQAKLSDPQYPYITRLFGQDVESYATELNSTVDNLVNSIDPNEGSVSEPYRGGGRSTRSEEAYARITDENMIIATDKPIQSVQRLTCTVTGREIDITPYVFEAAEYGRLSSFDGVYPTSKAFAIYYSKGENNIKGLNFKSPSVFGGATSNYAITNIIKETSGVDISASAWNAGLYAQLSFNITYTPIFSSRIKVHKSLVDPNAPKSTLFFNQSDNVVETRFYGEDMKGAIARMGNVEEVRTYLLASLDYIPKAGQLWGNDYYVSGVANALYGTYCECTVALTKNYNRKSQYIGINSEWRAYEVSENTAYRRNMIYTVYAVIGSTASGDFTLITPQTAQYIKQCFQKTNGTNSITAAVVYSKDENENTFATNTLPVISTAFGDVLSFQFGMADNYSAGAKSVREQGATVSGWWQTDSPYVDYYGEMFAMGIKLCLTGVSTVTGGGGFDPQAIYNLPQGDYGVTPIFQTDEDNPFRVEKNGGEILSLNYELQFVTTIPELIIGSALARRCPLIGAVNANDTGLYIMPNRIGKFDGKIDLAQATRLSWSPSGTGNGQGNISFDSATATVGGAAWVIADEQSGDILLAANTPITAGQTVNIPPISFTHDLS